LAFSIVARLETVVFTLPAKDGWGKERIRPPRRRHPDPATHTDAKQPPLLAALRRGPRTWADLAALGMGRTRLYRDIDQMMQTADVRVRVGPLLIELEYPDVEGEIA
jgi:hypothetical protein